ncbi:telomere-protecting terminal protein Tpg [Streptomyces sp. NPDC055632]
MANKLTDSLDNALAKVFTRPAPKSVGAQMNYLVGQFGGTKAAAQALGISQRTVERYIAGKLKRPRQDLRDCLEREVKRRWQSQIRAKARQEVVTTGGTVVSTRASFGYEAAAGTTDEARIRDITQALPPIYVGKLFTARERGDTEEQLQKIAAEGLAEMYFRANNTRAHGIEIRLTDIEHIGIEL